MGGAEVLALPGGEEAGGTPAHRQRLPARRHHQIAARVETQRPEDSRKAAGQERRPVADPSVIHYAGRSTATRKSASTVQGRRSQVDNLRSTTSAAAATSTKKSSNP